MITSMKTYLKNNWAMYSIICFMVVFIIGISIYLFQNRYEQKKSCSILDQQSILNYEYVIEGSAEQIQHVTVHITADLVEDITEDDVKNIALQLAGSDISYIQNSEAIRVTFDQKKQIFHLYIDITPNLLSSYDYEYLNANGFYLLGTIEWDSANVEDLATVLQLEGYTCN